jgi:hypothetical protein
MISHPSTTSRETRLAQELADRDNVVALKQAHPIRFIIF